MKIAICDDEKKFLNKVKDLIVSNYAAHDKLTICEFESGEQFLSHFKANQYDVIILDIEMKELTGLDVAEKIRETDKSVIIAFLTSHQEFAPKGYEVNAFRYLLKGQPEHMYIKQLRSIFNEYHQSHMTIPVQMSNTVFNVAVSDILYFEIYKRTIVLHTRTNKYQFNGKLSEIEKDERLVNFVKPHKSYYVNLSYIDNIEPTAIIMKNSDKIPLSRNFKKFVTDKFVSFLTARC